jgi:hypothetical protein
LREIIGFGLVLKSFDGFCVKMMWINEKIPVLVVGYDCVDIRKCEF